MGLAVNAESLKHSVRVDTQESYMVLEESHRQFQEYFEPIVKNDASECPRLCFFGRPRSYDHLF